MVKHVQTSCIFLSTIITRNRIFLLGQYTRVQRIFVVFLWSNENVTVNELNDERFDQIV